MMKIKPRDIRRRLLSLCPAVALLAVLTGPGQAKASPHSWCVDWCDDLLMLNVWFCQDTQGPAVNECIDDALVFYEQCLDDCEFVHGGGEDQCGPTDLGCDPFDDF